MADPKTRHRLNAPGAFFVDEQSCTVCHACIEEAPEHFVADPGTVTVYVKKQPQTPEEIARCWKAIDGCPVDAIGCSETRPKPDPKRSSSGSASDGAKPWWRFW